MTSIEGGTDRKAGPEGEAQPQPTGLSTDNTSPLKNRDETHSGTEGVPISFSVSRDRKKERVEKGGEE